MSLLFLEPDQDENLRYFDVVGEVGGMARECRANVSSEESRRRRKNISLNDFCFQCRKRTVTILKSGDVSGDLREKRREEQPDVSLLLI